MDILITLPDYLIRDILTEKKTFEVRKTKPRKFSFNDRCFVVEKGTRSVVLQFRIRCFAHFDNVQFAWAICGGLIGVDYDWFCKYIGSSTSIYLWSIESPQLCSLTLEDIGVKKAPQSFTYIPF